MTQEIIYTEVDEGRNFEDTACLALTNLSGVIGADYNDKHEFTLEYEDGRLVDVQLPQRDDLELLLNEQQEERNNPAPTARELQEARDSFDTLVINGTTYYVVKQI